ncbi:MAG: threonylcarbamoyl-AMP synthase [Oscillospiraceae bacterium]|jgi:L-threonylcarbamoyladenylate synthase|nr:threonylcarbamoyl-AMP synthase [Oscillospiraceae bacterium]
MITEVLPVSAAAIERAALLLSGGAVVAFPTETVYGLGANALDEKAVRGIFAAKDRPADNPLIAHIDKLEMLPQLTNRVPPRAYMLMAAFWPGPLTLILPRGPGVPDVVSAGLPTIAVRMPLNPHARALITTCGFPIAAPSANRSGRPSPTTAQHVREDLAGRIPLILDGGACAVGVESTVVDMTGETPALLRPGGVTPEMLRALLPDLAIDPAVLSPLAPDAAAASPGMRHRHYAPRARITVVRGDAEAVAARICARYDATPDALILCPSAHAGAYAPRRVLPLGEHAAAMAAHLFDALREADRLGAGHVLAEAVETEGIGLALMNRLLRAADFDVMDV